MRKIIQICSNYNSDAFDNESLYALCDDGTVWAQISGKLGWLLLPAIPQDNKSIEEYLNAEIENLVLKDRQQGLNEEEKQKLKELLEQKKSYCLYRI